VEQAVRLLRVAIAIRPNPIEVIFKEVSCIEICGEDSVTGLVMN
jgi:hypothetical protein